MQSSTAAGRRVQPKECFSSQMEEWHQTIGQKDCGYPGNKETERKRASGGKKGGYSLRSLFGKV